jgi:branched-chain amino acid transport system ATP-binding protein
MMETVQPILECREIAKHYGALAAVDGVSLTVQPGETVGIGGPNGAGKTTFFDMISGLTPVSQGQVVFDGRAITGMPPHRLFHVGLARTFQVTPGFGSLTVLQNMLASVVFGTQKAGAALLFNRSQREQAMHQLEMFGLSGLSNSPVANIPALARKKLMVATAVVHQPKILLLDEPVSGLLPAEVDEFIALMKSLRSAGICIIFIEHVMRFLTAVADRVLIMHQGKLIFDGTPEGFTKDELVRSVYLGSETVTERG